MKQCLKYDSSYEKNGSGIIHLKHFSIQWIFNKTYGKLTSDPYLFHTRFVLAT